MKKLIIPFLFFAGLFIDHGCKKTTGNTVAPSQSRAIENARKFFESAVLQLGSGPDSGQHAGSMPFGKSPDWQHAQVSITGHDSVVVVPLLFNRLFYIQSTLRPGMYLISDASRLIIYKDAFGKQQAEVLTFAPDSSYISAGKDPFTGIVRSEDWQGKPIRAFIYVGSNKPGPAVLGASVEICYTYEGYNYSAGDEDNVYYWTEDAGCEQIIPSPVIEDVVQQQPPASPASVYQAAAGGAAGGGVPAAKMVVAAGTSIIGSIADYDKCFTNVAGAAYTYQVTLCVDQPVPGTRDTWGFSVVGSSSGSQTVNVGHTFLIFTQSNSSGTTTRNVGFYPKDYVSPLSPSDPGQLNNDSQHGYDVSLTVTVNNSQFFNMLAFVAGGNSETYNLNSFNCTSFALQTLAAGNVNISSSKGSWTGGGGYDPGDLGQDIRGMTLAPGMSRSTTDPAHPNLGTCQ